MAYLDCGDGSDELVDEKVEVEPGDGDSADDAVLIPTPPRTGRGTSGAV